MLYIGLYLCAKQYKLTIDFKLRLNLFIYNYKLNGVHRESYNYNYKFNIYH
jgi:hypothetical protein